jgi:hypothetical protein
MAPNRSAIYHPGCFTMIVAALGFFKRVMYADGNIRSGILDNFTHLYECFIGRNKGRVVEIQNR